MDEEVDLGGFGVEAFEDEFSEFLCGIIVIQIQRKGVPQIVDVLFACQLGDTCRQHLWMERRVREVVLWVLCVLWMCCKGMCAIP